MSTPLDDMREMRDQLTDMIATRDQVAEKLGIAIDSSQEQGLLAQVTDRLAVLEADAPPEIPEMWLIVFSDRHPVQRIDFDPGATFPPEVIAVIHVTPDGAVTLERT